MRILTTQEQRARYEREMWEYNHPFRTLAGEILEELPILYFFVGWLSFFLLFSANPIVFYTGTVLFGIWFLLVAFAMAGAD